MGLDGYFAQPSDNFRYVFGTTIRVVRRITRKPVLISETAVGKETRKQPARIASLFAGIRRRHLLGMVWFDRFQHQDIHHQNWRLEGNPTALRAFIKATRSYR